MAKTKSHKFILSEEDEFNFDLIGICSHAADYKLAWDLNKTFHFDLEYSQSMFAVYPKRNHAAFFPYYYQHDEENLLSVYLIKNKHEGKFLIPELSQMDYFLFFVNNQVYDMTEINSKIRTMQDTIFASYIFDPGDYDSVENILFE